MATSLQHPVRRSWWCPGRSACCRISSCRDSAWAQGLGTGWGRCFCPCWCWLDRGPHQASGFSFREHGPPFPLHAELGLKSQLVPFAAFQCRLRNVSFCFLRKEKARVICRCGGRCERAVCFLAWIQNVLQSLLFLFVGLVSHQKSVELCAGCWGWAGAAGQRGGRWGEQR